MHDSAPANVLDRLIRGLQASIQAFFLVANPQKFEGAALLAEHISGAHREAAHGSPATMDLGIIHGNRNSSSNNPT